MADSNLDELIGLARDKISAIISKPKMTEKLLAKPPFRFLHDTISAVTAATGFGNGLYNEQELDSGSMTDKHAKMAYLDKIFNLVGICKGVPLEVKSLKVVQGLEPEYTNQFLIALAECSTDGNLDFEEAVRRCLSGDQPGQGPPPYKRGGGGYSAVAESKDSGEGRSGGRQSKHQADDNKFADEVKRMPEEREAKLPADVDRGVAQERGKSRGGTRGGKPNQATTDTGLAALSSGMVPKLDAEIEKCDGSEAMTQQLLGELITRPKLTEKYLAKPPFRFLHDIVMEVIRATGFARGLYNDQESDSANVTDKNQKMQFLEKIIKVVGVQLNTLVEARPNRIVAGLDPQITNNFLQLLAVAAKHMPDSTNAVRTVLEQFGGGGGGDLGEGNNSLSPPSRPAVESKNEPMDSKHQDDDRDRRFQSQQAQRSPPQQQQVFSEPKEERFAAPTSRQEERKDYSSNMQSVDLNMDDGGADSKRSARPTTARRRPPKVKDGATELQSKDTMPAPKKTTGIILDGANDDEDEDIADETRLADDFKADAKTEDSNANQSKLVQDIKARQLEQEAAIRAQRNEAVEETKIINESNGNTAGGGIRLGRLRKTGLEKKAVGTTSVTNFAEGDLEKIRASIQQLVQQTGPLGSCMDFIQEDLSLMNAELAKWEEECRRYESEYEDAKKKTKDSLHPLKVELADIEDQIQEQIAKISSAKAANARNDEKIQNLLKMMANA